MSKDTVETYAKKLGIPTEKLLDQLRQAGVKDKVGAATLEEGEKNLLREFKDQTAPTGIVRTGKFSRQRTVREEIKQPTQIGLGRVSRSVRVERKVKRNFIDRRVLEAELNKKKIAEESKNPIDEAVGAEEAVAERIAAVEPVEAIPGALVAEGGESVPEGSATVQGVQSGSDAPGKVKKNEIDEARFPDAKGELSEAGKTDAEPGSLENLTGPLADDESVVLPSDSMPDELTGKVKGKGKRKSSLHEKSSDSKSEDADGKSRDNFSPGKKSKPLPDSAKAGRKRDAKKWRMDNWNTDDDESGGREELHALRRRERKRSPAGIRKAGSVSTSMTHQHGFEKPTSPVIHEVIIPETITVGDLAQAMSVKAGEVVKELFQMGMMVTINQLLDQDTAILLVEEMGHVARPAVAEDVETVLKNEVNNVDMATRPPVVTVMGHVDHGKTSLLDYLRKTKVVAGEAGGITQHIGAYRIQVNNQEICFLDTPGHEAFTAMRARGTKATDLVILVVAADDGVKPQTVEAINHAKSAEVPIIVAINKIDREEADAGRIQQELSNHDLIPEEWGGDILMNEVSALTGQGVDALLESVMVQAELCDLKAKPAGKASGLVIEARLDKGKGPVATLLVKEGSLKKGDILLAGEQTGKIRALGNDQGKMINEAGPSTPVEVQGLTGVPVAGDDFMVVVDEKVAREIASSRQGKSKERKTAQQQKSKMEQIFSRMEEEDAKTLNILIKADVQGSVEALKESLNKLSSSEVNVKVVHGMVGGINESDVNLAKAVDAVIIGFNVRADATARKLIDLEGTTVFYHNIIYDVVDTIRANMTGLMDAVAGEEHVGLVEVRDVFRSPKIGAVAGCYVTKGAVKRNLPVRVLRDNIVIFEGAINSLRRFKDDVNEVKHGYECGIGIKDYNDIKVGDQIEVYEVVHSAPTL